MKKYPKEALKIIGSIYLHTQMIKMDNVSLCTCNDPEVRSKACSDWLDSYVRDYIDSIERSTTMMNDLKSSLLKKYGIDYDKFNEDEVKTLWEKSHELFTF